MSEKEKNSHCPSCGKSFHCSPSGKCWCYAVDVPVRIREALDEKYDSCLCEACLEKTVRRYDGRTV